MSAFTNDFLVVEEFKDMANDPIHRHENGPAEFKPAIFEWTKGNPCGSAKTFDGSASLASHLRVISTWLDYPSREKEGQLLGLLEQFEVPSSFLLERIRGVCHSFGTRTLPTGTQQAWFHTLCKDIPLESNDNSSNSYRIRNNVNPREDVDLSQADGGWHRSAYFLTVTPVPQRTVTLLCFGPPMPLHMRFLSMIDQSTWTDALEEPYLLFQVVMEEHFRLVDEMAWNLAKVFGDTEIDTLALAKDRSYNNDNFDFVGLHSIAKHSVYIREGVDAMLLTVQAMRDAHQRHGQSTNPHKAALQEAFSHHIALFRSMQLRVQSLEKRMQNIINLSFNLVTQADSRRLRLDSSSMKTIAIVTLVFLPISTIATIFGTQFFSYDGNGSFHTNPLFAILWAISLPVTGAVLGVWRCYHRRQQARISMNSEKSGGRRIRSSLVACMV